MDTVAITATLKNAEIRNIFGQRTVAGDIYGDVHKRWEDGHRVYTSPIRQGPNNKTLGLGLVRTHSGSVYKLEMKT